MFVPVVNQWAVPYGIPVITIEMSGVAITVAPYYPNLVKGYLAGGPGGSEIEIVGRVPGGGAVFNDAKNLGIFGMLIFFVLGNIAYFGRKFTGGS